MKKLVAILIVLLTPIVFGQTKVAIGKRQLEIRGEHISTFTQSMVRFTCFLEVSADSLIYYQLSSMKDSSENKYLSCEKYSTSLSNIDLKKSNPKINKDQMGFYSDDGGLYTIFLDQIFLVNWWDISSSQIRYDKLNSIILKFTDKKQAKALLSKLKKPKST